MHSLKWIRKVWNLLNIFENVLLIKNNYIITHLYVTLVFTKYSRYIILKKYILFIM